MQICEWDKVEPAVRVGANFALATLRQSINLSTGTLIAAAVHTTLGGLIPGALLGLTIPTVIDAEQAAIAGANSLGLLDKVTTLYLAQRREQGQHGWAMPCGKCAQLLYDVQTFTGQSIMVVSVNPDREYMHMVPVTELLPHAFQSRKLLEHQITGRGATKIERGVGCWPPVT